MLVKHWVTTLNILCLCYGADIYKGKHRFGFPLIFILFFNEESERRNPKEPIKYVHKSKFQDYTEIHTRNMELIRSTSSIN